MNSIGKIALNFKGDNEAFFRSLYGNWESFYAKNIESPTDGVLMQFDNDDIQLELNTIELDLGYVSEENFAEQFATLYREKLAETLQACLYNTADTNVKRLTKSKKLSEILCHFLLYGSLPWNVEIRYKDINYLFLEVVQKEADVLKKFLHTYGHYTSLQQRLVFQLGDSSLEEGVRLIAPGESSFIISYVHFLQSKYKNIERPVIKESSHRHVVWEVVYAYLLNNKSSFFNKKAFLKYTIKSLSARHNMPYSHLLKIVAAAIESRYKDISTTPELFTILHQLESEVPKEALEGSVTAIAKLYKVLALTQQSNQKQGNDNRKVLENILKKEDSCRQFLQFLDEPEIIRLVKIVVPNDYNFVVGYAKSLDHQREHGALQGKAGGEFRLLKWQIIFPVLLESNSTGFNRKYFVLRTLKKVAAHYNLEIHDILAYFLTTGKEALSHDENLRVIFEDIFTGINSKQHKKESIVSSLDFKVIVQFIKEKKELPGVEGNRWKMLLSVVEFREKVLDALKTETEHIDFINIIFPQHGGIISAYAKSLDVYQKRKVLEGKTGGKFMQLKWKFIHAVLFEPQQQVFNKKYFVTRVLLRISAHYNLKAEELIIFFYKELIKKGSTLPFELVKVLKELYEDHIKASSKKTKPALVNNSVALPEEKAKKRLLYYFGNDATLTFFIETLAKEHEFVTFIEEVLKAEMALRKFVTTESGIVPDNKRLLQLLMRLSVEYHHLSRTAIMGKIIMIWMDSMRKENKHILFEKQLQEIAITNTLIKETLNNISEFSELMEVENKQEHKATKKQLLKDGEVPLKEENISAFISNAGLVILGPYLARLFEMLSLTIDNKFTDIDARIKAIFVMQYAVFGLTEFAEHELELNKLLTGIAAGTPIPPEVELKESEKEVIDGLLKAVIQNWSKLGNTSIDGLRGNFLIRNGKLEEHEDFYQLTVEEKAYDILLVSLPWSIGTIKLSWMEKGINVKWR